MIKRLPNIMQRWQLPRSPFSREAAAPDTSEVIVQLHASIWRRKGGCLGTLLLDLSSNCWDFSNRPTPSEVCCTHLWNDVFLRSVKWIRGESFGERQFLSPLFIRSQSAVLQFWHQGLRIVSPCNSSYWRMEGLSKRVSSPLSGSYFYSMVWSGASSFSSHTTRNFCRLGNISDSSHRHIPWNYLPMMEGNTLAVGRCMSMLCHSQVPKS